MKRHLVFRDTNWYHWGASWYVVDLASPQLARTGWCIVDDFGSLVWANT